MGFYNNLQNPKVPFSTDGEHKRTERLWFKLDPDTLYIEECNGEAIRFLNKTRPKDILGMSLFHILAHPLDAIKIKRASANAETGYHNHASTFTCEIVGANDVLYTVIGQFSIAPNHNDSLFLCLILQYSQKDKGKSSNNVKISSNPPPEILDKGCKEIFVKDAISNNQQYRILIAEDDEASGYMLCEYLSRLNLETDWVFNGKLAYERALRFDYDLILVDDHMPIMGGNDLVKKLRRFKKYSHTPIIALTGSSFGDSYESLKGSSVNRILLKPYCLSEVENSIYDFLC